MKKKKRKRKQKLYLLSTVVFLLGFQLSLVIYVLSSFIKELTGTENVGIFYFIAYAASFYILINLHHLIKRHGKSRTLLLFMIVKMLTLLAMGVFSHNIFVIIFAVWSLVGDALIWASLDVLIESFTRNSITGKVRGTSLTFMDLGFLFGPFLAAWTVENFGFGPVFILASLITAVAAAIIYGSYGNINHSARKSCSARVVLKKMLKRKNLLRIFYASLILELFYCVMSVFTPLYLLSIGFSWLDIGKIITVMLIPFVIIQIPLGIIADTRTGEKEWLIIGIIIMSLSTGAISFISSTNLIFWMVILFITRIGASIIQVMRDTYFYKKVDPRDIGFIDYFRTTKSLAFIFGMAFFSFFLIVLPLQMLFLMLAVLIFTALAPVFRLNDTK
ncbi:MAG: MFS transporter [Patescibacteria group bacterium]|nr:MFS transporter [Patescibacteria group bacterium]